MSVNILRFIIPKSLVEHITLDSTVRQALEKMAYHRYTAIPVLDSEGKYVGTVRTDDIFSFFLNEGSFDKTAAESYPISYVMKEYNPKPIRHDTTMSVLIDNVKEHNFVPVVDDRDCFIGIILRRDILNFLLNFYNEKEED